MIRWLFKFLFSLLVIAVIASALTVAWMIYDGLNDVGLKADVALVPGQEDVETVVPGPLVQPRLDRAIALYQANEVSSIMVSGPGREAGHEEPEIMQRYLEDHGIPSGAIITNDEGLSRVTELPPETQAIAHRWAEVLKYRGADSVMIVTQYYQVERWKLALQHEGVTTVEHAHVGHPEKADATDIGRELIAFYRYLEVTYVLPDAKEFSEKAKTAGENAKATIDQKIDSLAK
jgi:vancomycin permeability regulator SanA